jgi:hypothetical protein
VAPKKHVGISFGFEKKLKGSPGYEEFSSQKVIYWPNFDLRVKDVRIPWLNFPLICHK